MQDFVSLAIFSYQFEPNGHDHGTEANAARTLAVSKDHIQVGMAAEFVLTNCDDQEVSVSSPRFQDELLISELHRWQTTMCWDTSISIGFCKLITIKETQGKSIIVLDRLGELVRNFMKNSASQLTIYGLFSLHKRS